MTLARRNLLRTMAAVAAGFAPATTQGAPAAGKPGWAGLARHYDLATDFVNLENAYYGVMARPVLDDYKRNIDYLNRHNSRYLRRDFDREGGEAIRAAVAQYAGVPVNAIALTRGATESLQNLIANYRLLKAGDTVMYGNLDYGSMQYAMDDLAQRHGATVAVVTIPEPASRQRVIDAYEQALQRQPRTRLRVRRRTDPIDALYSALCKRLAQLGHPRLPGEGPTAYAIRLAGTQLDPARQRAAAQFLRCYSAYRYGPAAPAPITRIQNEIGRAHV